jgi:hypothetical protein
LKQTEAYSPWQNAAESVIRELKKGAGRKIMVVLSTYESLIRSNTAHDIYELGGETPEIIISGETPDISQLCELGWYECKYHDASPTT